MTKYIPNIKCFVSEQVLWIHIHEMKRRCFDEIQHILSVNILSLTVLVYIYYFLSIDKFALCSL